MASSGRTICPSLRPSGKSSEPFARELQLGVLADILRRGLDGSRKRRVAEPPRTSMRTLEPSKPSNLRGVFEQRRVATFAHGGQNRRDDALGFFEAHGLALDERTARPWL